MQLDAEPANADVAWFVRRARVGVVALAALLTANNLRPYFGLGYEGCQTMFSGLSPEAPGRSHLLMPQISLDDGGAYYREMRADGMAIDQPALVPVARWLSGVPGLAHNAEAVRAAVDRLCAAGLRPRLSFRTREGQEVRVEDACSDGTLEREVDAHR